MRSRLLEKIAVGANSPSLGELQRAETVTILLITGAGKTQMVEHPKVRKRKGGHPSGINQLLEKKSSSGSRIQKH